MGELTQDDRAGIAQGTPGSDSLLAGVRRMTLLADEASDVEAIFRELARELLEVPGADEVHVHHLSEEARRELVVVYLHEGDGRLSYLFHAVSARLGWRGC